MNNIHFVKNPRHSQMFQPPGQQIPIQMPSQVPGQMSSQMSSQIQARWSTSPCSPYPSKGLHTSEILPSKTTPATVTSSLMLETPAAPSPSSSTVLLSNDKPLFLFEYLFLRKKKNWPFLGPPDLPKK